MPVGFFVIVQGYSPSLLGQAVFVKQFLSFSLPSGQFWVMIGENQPTKGDIMRIAIGSDHAGFQLKEYIEEYLTSMGHEPIDCGAHTADSTDYPIYAKKVCELITGDDELELGILICGTGAGISITANKIKGIRAVVCSDPLTARLAREHNNANVLAFGARIVGNEMAKMIVREWLDASFDGDRHERRVGMIESLEQEG